LSELVSLTSTGTGRSAEEPLPDIKLLGKKTPPVSKLEYVVALM
jgi:hypothetical protein